MGFISKNSIRGLRVERFYVVVTNLNTYSLRFNVQSGHILEYQVIASRLLILTGRQVRTFFICFRLILLDAIIILGPKLRTFFFVKKGAVIIVTFYFVEFIFYSPCSSLFLIQIFWDSFFLFLYYICCYLETPWTWISLGCIWGEGEGEGEVFQIH